MSVARDHRVDRPDRLRGRDLLRRARHGGRRDRQRHAPGVLRRRGVDRLEPVAAREGAGQRPIATTRSTSATETESTGSSPRYGERDRARHPRGRAALARLGRQAADDRLRHQRGRHPERARGDPGRTPPRRCSSSPRPTRSTATSRTRSRSSSSRRGGRSTRTTPTRTGSARTCRSTAACTACSGRRRSAADILVQEYGRYFGMRTACFRGGTLTGPRHSATELHGFLAYVMRCAMTGTPYTVFGYKGKQVRDAIHSLDLIRAFDAFFRAPRVAEVYNIGGGQVQQRLGARGDPPQRGDRRRRRSTGPTDDRSRVGDHIWWIGDNGRFESHYPDWKLEYDVRRILEEIHAANADRWSRDRSPGLAPRSPRPSGRRSARRPRVGAGRVAWPRPRRRRRADSSSQASRRLRARRTPAPARHVGLDHPPAPRLADVLGEPSARVSDHRRPDRHRLQGGDAAGLLPARGHQADPGPPRAARRRPARSSLPTNSGCRAAAPPPRPRPPADRARPAGPRSRARSSARRRTSRTPFSSSRRPTKTRAACDPRTPGSGGRPARRRPRSTVEARPRVA